jgi:hypothetical protein
MVKKLACDRCGFELTDRDEIELALEGIEAWQNSVRLRGEKPRGCFPCKHYIRCHGEMQAVFTAREKLRNKLPGRTQYKV